MMSKNTTIAVALVVAGALNSTTGPAFAERIQGVHNYFAPRPCMSVERFVPEILTRIPTSQFNHAPLCYLTCQWDPCRTRASGTDQKDRLAPIPLFRVALSNLELIDQLADFSVLQFRHCRVNIHSAVCSNTGGLKIHEVTASRHG